jgi:hypothetical protein
MHFQLAARQHKKECRETADNMMQYCPENMTIKLNISLAATREKNKIIIRVTRGNLQLTC